MAANAQIDLGRVVIHPGERTLVVDGKPCPLGARAFDLLLVLAEQRDRVVSKAELFDRVWPGVVVEENNLQVHVSAIRKALGPQAITTVPGRGYQFTLPIEQAAPTQPQPAHPSRNSWAAGVVAAAVLLTGAGIYVAHGVHTPPSVPLALEVPTIEQDPSIVVLPLANLSSDKEQEYFADGITEELSQLLARVRGLRVIARTSSFAFKGRNVPVETIARQLHVASVLEGSVRRSGDKVRVQVQLVRASDSSRIWAESYEREMADIFRLQDEIAATVVEKLRGRLLADAPRSKPLDPRAYQLVLQARASSRRADREGHERAMQLYREALGISPDEPSALLGLAREHIVLGGMAMEPAREFREARRLALRALQADAYSARAMTTLGVVAEVLDGQTAEAAAWMQKALASDPTDPEVLIGAAHMLQGLGRHSEAVPIMRHRVAHDPANPVAHVVLGGTLVAAGHVEEGIESLRTALALSPSGAYAHVGLSRALLLQGDAEGALREALAEPEESYRLAAVAMAQHALGHRAESDDALRRLIATAAQPGAYNIAEVLAFRGEAERAFEWIERAIRNKDGGLTELPHSPFMRALHQDARWASLLRRINRSPQQLAAISLRVELPK